ncbi:MAG: MBL fold metallo-hydrolase [Carnobacterium sp.]|uniref:MBL fold metallo-hydrolase n=1 Tax=Carnobacterium antarcticum TaxID=2126436 RepID=A0ABW4NK70_9LACT|nr:MULTISPECIES: MBL fold metallo-hydrolase [unclassified Carnobacterium]ALV21951.1 Hydroxyacylglutathione hydrolase [Carnobacterium sp. CP1]QQP69923.1 MBL fold metallo-hydrolase [Carnobacterium sp. CS13]
MAEVKRIATGAIEENCYIIYENLTALIVDPGNDFQKIMNAIEELQVTPAAILLTHCHYDHIGALEETRTTYNIPVYVSSLEKDWLGNPELNLSAHGDKPIIAQPAEFEFELMKDYTLGGLTFRVVPTPGHSPGGISFIFEDFVITGDALFKGSIGRSDLPGSNPEALLEGIREQLFNLEDEMRIYPGHGGASTIGDEKLTNPFFN